MRVHDSQTYRKMDVTRERISRIMEQINSKIRRDLKKATQIKATQIKATQLEKQKTRLTLAKGR